ncbi:type IV pilus biogenesis protein PilP [Ralstonia chuxiongensis]|uniref:type IV pilus biogenesis protein PilP n=1 Tax=Ralstonia chuxiongensis TaxID=2957504 RepID=UPI0028F66326|nr:type IV pilus biogenesis protein PilP [Ralstonia chuxiongensis]CAJ0781297.1 hypothetical protein R8510_04855 [Ralstonia chuxiongensis]
MNRSFLIALAAILPLFAHAQPNLAPAATVARASAAQEPDELGALQKRKAIAKERAEIVKYEADIKAAEARAQQSPAAVPSMPAQGVALTGSLPVVTLPTAVAASNKPRLLNIGGAGSQYVAHLEVSGRPADVVVGDPVEGGWTVASIDASHVKLVRGKQVLMLKV